MRPVERMTRFVRGVGAACRAANEHWRAGERPRKVVVITGSSSGLGLALAHRFARSGARIVLASRSVESLERAKSELLAKRSAATADDVLIVPCDVKVPVEAIRLIEQTVRHFKALDVLINNAGIIHVGPVETHTVDAYEDAMKTNFFGAVHTVQAALPYMLESRAGSIVNIASIGGKFAMPHLLPYVASKFALVGYSEGLHSELRHKGIRVTTVCPGLMRTGSQTHAIFTGDQRAESRWFSLAATTPLLAASAKRAANQIFAAVQSGRAEITITPQAWLAARFVGVAPECAQVGAALINELLLPRTPAQSTTKPADAQPATS